MDSDLDRSRHQWLPGAALLCAVVFQHAIFFNIDWAQSRFIAYPLLILTSTAATYFAWQASIAYSGRSRAAWRMIALSAMLRLPAWLIYGWYQIGMSKPNPVGSFGDLFMVASDVCMVLAFIEFVKEKSPREHWTTTILDGTTVGVAYFLWVWLFIISGAVPHFNRILHASIASNVAGASLILVNIVVVAFAFLLLIRDRMALTTPRSAIVYATIAVACRSGASILYVSRMAQGRTEVSPFATPFYIDAALFLCAAAWFAHYRKSRVDEMLSVRRRAYASTFTVLTMMLITGPTQYVMRHGEPDNVSVSFGVFMVGLVIFRQLLLLNENVSLNEDLEQRVEKRTTELTAREERFRSLVTNSSDVITILDEDGVVKYVSPSVHQVFGYRPESWIDWRLSVHVEPEEAELLHETLEQAKMQPGEPISLEWSIRHRDGSLNKVESSVTALLHEPSVQGIVLNTRDVSERRALEHRLRHQASHDALTGLANRNLFKTRMAAVLERASHGEGTFALLFCDLDEFKAINDSLGHAVGDEVLAEVAQRLRDCVRPGDTVARLGGDEFAVILEHIESEEDAAWIAERIKQEVTQPFNIRGREMFVGVSVGIATSFTPYDHLDDLLAKADIAMYMAKSRGKGNHVRFDPEMHEAVLRQLALEEDLKHALENDELVVYYQPINDLESQRIVSFEALIRWIHPQHGLIPPNDFIPLAEQTGIIKEIGEWVLRQSCMQLSQWQAQYPHKPPLAMSVNLSGRQLSDPGLVDIVADAIETSGIAPRTLTLEMTESILLNDADGVVEQLERLRDLGVRLAIDDFGTGYSSLSYLRHFPVDVLKIDRSFVKGLGTEEQDLALVQAIMSLGDVMSLDTVAEGIENPEELHELQKIGCHLGQGFLFAKPAPPRDITTLLTGDTVAKGTDKEKKPKSGSGKTSTKGK